MPHLQPSGIAYARLLAQSFERLTGKSIIDGYASALNDRALAEALFHAPHAIVSHGTEADPVFRYANQAALKLWEMDWDRFTLLPSRLSAEADGAIQSDRNALLQKALQNGYVEDYQGIRVSSTGKRFFISDTVLWNVVDAYGTMHGQAAFIRRWSPAP